MSVWEFAYKNLKQGKYFLFFFHFAFAFRFVKSHWLYKKNFRAFGCQTTAIVDKNEKKLIFLFQKESSTVPVGERP